MWGRCKGLGIALVMSVLSGLTVPAWAYPDRPIKLIVAFPPGSSTDIVARAIAQPLGEVLGQPVVVENRGGAGGNIGTMAVARSPADGYTFLMHSVAYSVNPSLYTNAGYQVGKELVGVAMGAVSPNILYVHPSVKAKDLKELLALSKTEKLSYGSSGNGTTTHLGAELLFRNLAKVDIQHVPFTPAAAATAVVGNHVPIGSTSIPPVVQLAKAGRVRPIAVTSLKRSSALPDVPTVAELGYPGFEANTWFAMMAPAGVSTTILDRLNTEINRILQNRSINEGFAAQSLEAIRMGRAELDAYLLSESRKWAEVVKQTGAKVD
ncbi:MAG: tripartite tricarboxylate transporter substrate binding protein [Betaproteobacteria bacterium]|jgi:tripartite-type tricarboxylate transporter receptor subunit TctC|nr:tripartite tricarboxylate transporter substrate binding protein [Betaproteobacteria bacterium]